MSLFNCKDLDYFLLLSLTNSDLYSICKTNKYYYQIYNSEYFWRLKFSQDFPEIYKIDKKYSKEYYIQIWKSYNDEDFIRQIFEAIKGKNEDIAYLIFKRRNLNPNYNFHLRNEPDYIQKNTYVSPKLRGNELLVYGYSPIELCISWGNFETWKVLISFGANIEQPFLYKLSVHTGKKEFFDDLRGRDVPFPKDLLYYSIRCNNLEITKILLTLLEKKDIERNLSYLANEREPYEINSWIEEKNESCYTFLSDNRVKFILPFIQTTLHFRKLLHKYFPCNFKN